MSRFEGEANAIKCWSNYVMTDQIVLMLNVHINSTQTWGE